MKIAIIGAGNIGNTLGKKWAKAGHSIFYGVRDPEHARHYHLLDFGEVKSIEAALEPSKIVLLAIPGDAVAEFAEENKAALDGKLIIDATNNIHGGPMNNLETLFKITQNTQLIRAFSTLGWENFETPTINGQQVDLFFCGQSAAQAMTEKLIVDIGLRPVYLGPMEKADLVDGLTKIWFELVFGLGHKRRLMLKMVEEE